MRITQEALTFDDILLLPAYSQVLPAEVDLSTQLTANIRLSIPFVSAAMDTVTESKLAIALAQEGGMGVIHKNMSIQQQATEVLKVKKFESGIIRQPVTIGPNETIQRVIDLTKTHNISGVPVVENAGDLKGIVTARDLRFETQFDHPVSSVMTPKERLVTVFEGESEENVLRLFHKHRIEKVLVVNKDFQLRGMITVKDIQKSSDYPNACKDEQGHLRVGAAVGVGHGTEDRVFNLVEAGADVIVVDTAHGHSQAVLDRVAWIRKNIPNIQIIGGNIATADGAQALVDAGADAVKVGIGPGSICTTRIIAGVGMPQITALMNVSEALHKQGIPFIADGGIRNSGDVSKALAAGASVVMLGGMFAGTKESPGEIELYQGRSYKSYRGMGSMGAMAKGSKDRYFQESENAVDKLVPEGIEGRVPYKGPLNSIVHQLVGGLRASMGYLGCKDIEEIHTKPECVRITSAGMRESHVHDVSITKEAPNYQR